MGANPTGVHGRRAERRDKWRVPGVSEETSRVLKALGAKAGLRPDQQKRVFGQVSTAPSDLRRRERGMVFGGSARAVLSGAGSRASSREGSTAKAAKAATGIYGGRLNGGGATLRTAGKVRVPKVGRGSYLPEYEPPKRPSKKPAEAIANEIAAIEAQQAAELRMMRAPGATRHIDGDQKRRLQDAYLGEAGSAKLGTRAVGGRRGRNPVRSSSPVKPTKAGVLPRVGGGSSPSPVDLDRLQPVVRSRGDHERAQEAAKLFDQIAFEVEERQAFMQEMIDMGMAHAHEARIRRELTERVAEMERLTEIINGDDKRP